jgi:RNA recognition motif-containing protein
MIMTPSIFCGDLSFFCTDADLCQLFQAVGPVRSAIVRRSRNNETLHYGFVHMETSEDAHRAIQSLNGQKFLGRRLRYDIFLLFNSFRT